MKVPNTRPSISHERVTHVPMSLCLVIGVALLAANIRAQDPRQASRIGSQTPGQSVVTGRVVLDDTGQPVPKVRVQLIAIRRPANPRIPVAPLLSITNDQGEFRFNGVAAGEYNLIVQLDPRVSGAQSYVTPLGAGNPAADAARLEQSRQGSKKISVDGQSSVEIELRVANPHFGVISGYVVSSSGDVAVRARVMLSSTAKDGARIFGLSATTDDKGAFRFERVPPGEYILSADPPPKEQSSEGFSISPTPSLIPTYYPSTADAANAVPIDVAPDGETPGVNITLIELSAHRVSGTVKMRASGEPVPYVVVQLSPRSALNRSSAAGEGDVGIPAGRVPQIQRADENGRWSFNNVPDGAYVINVQARQLAPPGNSSMTPTTAGQSRNPTPKFAAKRQEVTVAGADLPDMTIEVSGGGRISGSVVVEGDKPLPPRIGIMASAKDRTQPSSNTTVQADGSFILSGVPEGEVSLVTSLRQPITFYVKAIEANGVDLLRERLRIEEGAEIKNVRIVISTDVAVLTGHVFASEGKTPLSRVAVILVPADPERRRLPTAQFTNLTNPDGSFLIGAAPGDYIVVAWRPGEPSPVNSEALARNPLRITLQAGERRSLDVLKR